MATNNNISAEDAIRQRIEQQKKIERQQINSALNLAEAGLSDVAGKLTEVYNILNEDILLDGMCFKSDDIKNITNQINLINR